jgi:hypothetical protein
MGAGARGSGPAATRLAGLGALALQLQVVRQVLHGAGLGGVLAAHHLRLRRGVSTRTRQAKQCGRLRCWGMRMCRRSRCGCGRSWRPRWPGAWSRSAPARKAQRSACVPLRSTQAAVRTLFAAVRASRSSVSAAWALGAAKKTADSAARPSACACGKAASASCHGQLIASEADACRTAGAALRRAAACAPSGQRRCADRVCFSLIIISAKSA